MEDFFYAGGVPGLLGRIAHLLGLGTQTVEGGTLLDRLDPTPSVYDDDVIRPIAKPIVDGPALAVLTGNLCPDGAVIKVSAASPRLTTHRGRALVFDSIEECLERIDDPALEVDASSILVLRNSGPSGYPGMPEIGGLPLPRKLLAEGVNDMVRISDARMSGTAYGTVVLHIAPESAVGGPLRLVESGDWIKLDVAARTLDLEVDEDELQRRAARLPALPELHDRGYLRLYREHVLGADTGADFDFLRGSSGSAIPRQSF